MNRDLTIGAISYRPSGPSAYNEPMPRTFSLARLMLGITVVSIVCGAVTCNPDYALIGLVFVPPAIVCMTLVSFARQRKVVVLSMSFLGALLGGLLSILLPRGPAALWDGVTTLLIPVSLGASLFAFLLGSAAIMDISLGRLDAAPSPPALCRPMPRTFSLARLMLGITAFCIVCAIAVNLPPGTKQLLMDPFGFIALLFAPTCVVVFLFARVSAEAAVVSLLGAILFLIPGFLLALVVYGRIPMLRQYTETTVAVVPALGALLLGGLNVFMSSRTRNRDL